MPSIGNDLVGLTLAANIGKSRDLRFIRRVCTLAEKDAVEKAENPDQVLWAFWACKEAAYKAAVKLRPVSFIPRSFQVHLDGQKGGWVHTPVGVFRVRLQVWSDFVHALAFSQDTREDDIATQIWHLEPGDESAVLRKRALSFLSRLLNYPEESLEIRRTREGNRLGPPRLFLESRPLKVDLSLSHDGQYGALAVTA